MTYSNTNDIDRKHSAPPVIIPQWPAQDNIRAYTTTRSGGVSSPPYHSLNLAHHVGDKPEAVTENRTRLHRSLSLPNQPSWLEQIHSKEVVFADKGPGQRGDASIASEPGPVCVILTADCLPLLLCDRKGTRVAAVHAGWRGLAAGLIEVTVSALKVPGESLLAWLGPAIGPKVFEVGPEVKRIFLDQDHRNASAFKAHGQNRWLADIYQIARLRLTSLGIRSIYAGHYCTVTDSDRFYSYRRDGQTGRMATLIWLTN